MSLAIILVCANPVGGESDEGSETQDLANAIETSFLSEQQVVAASPVPAGVNVGSHYGYRTSVRTGERTFHAGTDFLTPRGTPVYAVRGGVVEHVVREGSRSRRFAGYGNAGVVRHEQDGTWSFYAHLESIDVEEGAYVLPGDKLGGVGNTSNGRFPSMPPHLHFEVREARADGSSPFPGPYRRYNVDPEEWLADMGVRFVPAPDEEHPHHHPVLVVAESGTGTGTF